MRTFRRLDDPSRYYGLSWRGWAAVAAAAGLLYGFVQLSPLDAQATISVALIALVLPAMAASAASGQALGARRYLAAACGWLLRPKVHRHDPARRLPSGGVMLDVPPPLPADPASDWTDADALFDMPVPEGSDA